MFEFESTSMVVYTLFFVVVSTCFVLKTPECVANGMTVEYLLGGFIPKEYDDFVMHHIYRTTLTVIIHSCLPLIYVLGSLLVNNNADSFVSVKFYELLAMSILPIIMSVYVVCLWQMHKWAYHPLATTLSRYNAADWTAVGRELSTEWQSLSKLTLAYGTLNKTVVTESWVLSINSYWVSVSKKIESSFVVFSSDIHNVTPEGTPGGVQFINIQVIPIRSRIKWFCIRIKSEDFRTLEENIGQPIQIAPNVKLQRSRTERFVEVFRDQVSQNPVYNGYTAAELEDSTCAGCLVNPPDVKLNKCCDNNDNNVLICVSCQCRPMWCVDCMAKWYESRQSRMDPTNWLSSKCTCPLCRQVFCILDVCPLENSELAKMKTK